MKKYLILFSMFSLVACKSITDKNIETLEKQNQLIVSKTEYVKDKIEETKKVVASSNCEKERDIQEELNDVEMSIVEIQGENKVLENSIKTLKQGYSSEIKILNNKIFYRNMIILFLGVYVLKRVGVLEKITNLIMSIIKKFTI